MESIVEQIKQLAEKTDEAGRRNIADVLTDLSYSLETPKDTLARIMSYHLRISAVRTGIDLKLFSRLSASEKPLTVQTIAKDVDGGDASLIARYLRYLASIKMITETGKDTFTANSTTKRLADPGREATIIHSFDTVGPAYQATPAFLRTTNFTSPTSPTHSPFQLAYHTPLSAFSYFPQLPDSSLTAFDIYMSTRSAHLTAWLSVYPFLDEAAGCGTDEVVFVDVGGGIGHQTQALRQRYPDLQGRTIVQDLEHPIQGLVDHEGVEGMVHDFFEEQPIKGAHFYYLRAVLHDYPDEQCQVILARLRDAMACSPSSVSSKILIDELVLPNEGVPRQATHADLEMLACFAAQERTCEQWENMLQGVGLRIEKVRAYNGWAGCEAIMTVGRV
ncbi:S-adenosyl-L-methionine-dependent methyltransferase [Bisporella sp. PMI_857]|nr:S-adenosyl-L-methionine-dependent methyltransferase [Bisporella sp. PMI_857]